MEYVSVVFLVLKDEAEALMAAHPEVKEDLDAFLAVWGKEYAEALQEVVNKRQQ